MFIKLLTTEEILSIGNYASRDRFSHELGDRLWPLPYELKELGDEAEKIGWPEYEVRLILKAKAAEFKKSERRKLAELISKCRNGCGVAK